MVWEKSIQGLWSQEEMFKHINTREFQAASLILKMFSTSQIHQLLPIELQINQAPVSYTNHQEGTHLKLLCQVSLGLWKWSLSRQIHISARYTSRFQQTCRPSVPTAELKLNPTLFLRLVAVYGIRQIDLFMTRANTQLRKFRSWIPNLKVLQSSHSISSGCTLYFRYFPLQSHHEMCAKDKKSEWEILLATPV